MSSHNYNFSCPLIFFISNKFIDIKEGGAPYLSTQGVYKRSNNQEQKLQESRKSRKDKNDWFCNAANQSIKVLKKNSFKSDIDLSLSSKHLLFLSLQRHHNKQWGTINHIYPFRWQPNLPCQHAKSPTTNCSITQLTPNNPNTIAHISIATGQWRKRWSTNSPLHLHM